MHGVMIHEAVRHKVLVHEATGHEVVMHSRRMRGGTERRDALCDSFYFVVPTLNGLCSTAVCMYLAMYLNSLERIPYCIPGTRHCCASSMYSHLYVVNHPRQYLSRTGSWYLIHNSGHFLYDYQHMNTSPHVEQSTDI